jgi:hypothetical protein
MTALSEYLGKRLLPNPASSEPLNGAVTSPIGFFLVAMLAAAPATAQDSRLRYVGPDEADIRYIFECSELAKMHLLSFDDAADCTRAYMRIKLSFLPGVGFDDFAGLSPEEKAVVNTVGYQRFMEWRLINTAQVDALTTTPLSSSIFAEDRAAR